MGVAIVAAGIGGGAYPPDKDRRVASAYVPLDGWPPHVGDPGATAKFLIRCETNPRLEEGLSRKALCCPQSYVAPVSSSVTVNRSCQANPSSRI
jgi:hypothetical protein